MKKFLLAGLVTVASLFAHPASALFKSFDQIDQEYVAQHPPLERLGFIKSFVEHYDPFFAMDEWDRNTAFLMASAKIARETCPVSSVVDGKTVQTWPRWVLTVALLFDDLSSTVALSKFERPKHVLAWTIVGLMRDDPKPCDLAEALFKDLHMLN